MKRVFLIGDSIRIGYDSMVREMLLNRAQLYWVQDNAQYTYHTLRRVHEWAKTDCDPASIDVVHWNNGLWDVLRLFGDEPLVPVDAYTSALERIARRLKTVFPNAQIIFALTTSVIQDRMNPDFFRRNSDIEAYNAAARQVMERLDIPVNDLYTVAARMSPDWHSPDGTHFTPEGYQCLAEQVARKIEEYL